MMDIRNVMTVDVEDYYQVSAMESVIKQDDWNNMESRIERNMDKILQLFDEVNIKATFFTLGWIAEKYPNVIKQIVDNNHELASHGYSHTRLYEMTKSEFREDIYKTKNILENIGGVEVNGYRAPSFSVSLSNLWVFEVINECGYLYSSSIYPIKHDLYGIPSAPIKPFWIEKYNIIEIPISTLDILNRRVPCGGGGYFRLLPYEIYRRLIQKLNNGMSSCFFYFHPWEIDPDQPRINNLSSKSMFRHYVNLGMQEKKVKKLLREFNWINMDAYIRKNNKEIKSNVIDLNVLKSGML